MSNTIQSTNHPIDVLPNHFPNFQEKMKHPMFNSCISLLANGQMDTYQIIDKLIESNIQLASTLEGMMNEKS